MYLCFYFPCEIFEKEKEKMFSGVDAYFCRRIFDVFLVAVRRRKIISSDFSIHTAVFPSSELPFKKMRLVFALCKCV